MIASRPNLFATGPDRRSRLMARSRRGRNSGFTIFEVTMAGFVMALGIATSILAMQMGFKALNVARDTTLASQIIQSEIERLRLCSWTSITALDGTASVNLDTMFSSNSALATKFQVSRKVEQDDTRPSDVRKIKITVTWKSYDGRQQTREFSTIYAKNGLYDYYYTVATS